MDKTAKKQKKNKYTLKPESSSAGNLEVITIKFFKKFLKMYSMRTYKEMSYVNFNSDLHFISDLHNDAGENVYTAIVKIPKNKYRKSAGTHYTA